MERRKRTGFWASLILAALLFALYLNLDLDRPWAQLLLIAAIAALVLAVNFAIGWRASRRR